MIALWRSSLSVFVFVFVPVFLLARSCFLITLIKCLSGEKYKRSPFERILTYLSFSLSLSLYLYLSLFLSFCWSGHVFSSLCLKVKKSLWRCSLNVFVIVFVFVFVFVFMFVFMFLFVFLLIRSCLLITLMRCLKCHKCLGSLCNYINVVKCLIVSGARRTDGPTDIY